MRPLDRRVYVARLGSRQLAASCSPQDHGKTALYRVAGKAAHRLRLWIQQAQVGPFTVASNGSVVFGLTTAT